MMNSSNLDFTQKKGCVDWCKAGLYFKPSSRSAIIKIQDFSLHLLSTTTKLQPKQV